MWRQNTRANIPRNPHFFGGVFSLRATFFEPLVEDEVRREVAFEISAWIWASKGNAYNVLRRNKITGLLCRHPRELGWNWSARPRFFLRPSVLRFESKSFRAYWLSEDNDVRMITLLVNKIITTDVITEFWHKDNNKCSRRLLYFKLCELFLTI